MDALEKWVEDYALMYEREITKADCEAAYRAGMRRAAEIVAEQARKGAIMRVGDPAGLTKLRDAILAEVDK